MSERRAWTPLLRLRPAICLWTSSLDGTEEQVSKPYVIRASTLMAAKGYVGSGQVGFPQRSAEAGSLLGKPGARMDVWLEMRRHVIRGSY